MNSSKKSMCRVAALILVLVFAFATMTTALAYSRGDTLYAKKAVNVRSGPSTKYAVIGELIQNEQVTYLGRSGNWYKVDYYGESGYVYKTYLSSYETGASADVTKLYAASNASVYAGPGSSYSVLGTISKGQAITKLGASGNWLKVQYGSVYGYVNGSQFSATPIGSGSVSGNTQATLTKQTYAYLQPYSNSQYYTPALNAGTSVTCTGVVSGTWTEIIYRNSVAYVPTNCLNAGGNVTTAGTIAYINKVSNVYSMAPTSSFGTNSYLLGTLSAGTQVTRYESTGSYTRISYSFGSGYGYVLTSSLGSSYSPSPSPVVVSTSGNYRVISYTPIYDNPYYSGTVSGYLTYGDTVYCTGETINGFAQCYPYAGGTVGYVPVSALQGYSTCGTYNAGFPTFYIGPNYTQPTTPNTPTKTQQGIGKAATVTSGTFVYEDVKLTSYKCTVGANVRVTLIDLYSNGVYYVSALNASNVTVYGFINANTITKIAA